MDSRHFDALTKRLTEAGSRRGLLGLLATLPVLGGLVAFLDPDAGEARHNKKRRKKVKVRFNDFGCVNVGGFCKNGGQCCSGICQGKKGKKGKKKCKAHNVSTCQPDDDTCLGAEVGCTTDIGDDGRCSRTTGNASYCEASGNCTACTKDADCVAVCGAGAACIVCANCPESGGTACVGQSGVGCGF